MVLVCPLSMQPQNMYTVAQSTQTPWGGARAEDRQMENMSCVVVFMVYYFSIAASVWLVVVSYSLFITFSWAHQPHKVQEVMTSRAAYFLMVALSIHMVLIIVILAHKVDGNSVSGICMFDRDPLSEDPTYRELEKLRQLA